MNRNMVITYLRNLYEAVQEDEVSSLGAQLSYYLILSVFPFLIFLVTLLDYTPLTQQRTIDELSVLLPESAFVIVREILTEVAAADNFTLLSLGILGTIWTASRGSAALIKAINRAYGTAETRSFFKLNAIGVFSTFALALVIIFSLSLLVFGRYLGSLAFQSIGMEEFFYALWPFLRFGIPLLIIFCVFSLLYMYAPDCSLRFREIYPGALFSTFAWLAASQLFAYYVNNFGNFSRTYGSLGGIIVFLVWLYISSSIALLGAEINAVSYQTFTKKAEK
ncbi:MAG: YihY/virulence factor BrkB family protein [Bacillota bacterium]|nr:YihY/virulence factor BrkB family protein [Bacillota bacterium]MDW7683712.1 YihY/virulence factor BrkB family protein [Bacillota bacterium]